MATELQRRDFADGEDLAFALAEWTAERPRGAIAEAGAALLVVSGGRSPERFLHALSNPAPDWTRVAITLADQRRVAEDSPRVNAWRWSRRRSNRAPGRRRR
jgi:6-phosphogluconolactonase